MTAELTKPRRGRPPKSPRDNQDTRAALIRSGIEMLTEQGFASTGIEGVLKRVGVPKGSFYYYFENKEAFGRAVLDSYAKYFANKLDASLLDQSMAPLDRIIAFSEGAKEGMAKHQFRRGCLIGNLGQEVSILPESYRAILSNTFLNWQNQLEVCLLSAQDRGDLLAKADCKLLAEFFWIGWEGAVMRAGITENADPMDVFIKQYMACLPR